MTKEDLRKFLKETGLFLGDILYNAVVIIILVVLIRSFLISPFRVIGSSMADTLHNKEFILIDKLSYRIGDIERGDPIVFLPPQTSRDAPKFEETVTMDAEGKAIFEFGDLITQKKTDLCQDGFLSGFFFCRESVEEADLLYYAPRQRTLGGGGFETDWTEVNNLLLDKQTVKAGATELSGKPGESYTVRVYDSQGLDYFVKRVMAVPGDTIKIENGRVYLKGPSDEDFVLIDEPFLNDENRNQTFSKHSQGLNVFTVPEGSYFVLGDNRKHSNDSRDWLEPVTQEPFPFVPAENISGKVLVVLWPASGLRFIPSADF